MYNLIEAHRSLILSRIQPAHVSEYDWLISNLGNCGASGYQSRYCKYWRLNGAGLSQSFKASYFALLGNAPSRAMSAQSIASQLHATPSSKKGQSLQFSFATKLRHMLHQNEPIYDSMVASFYFYQVPKSSLPIQVRLQSLAAFLGFLHNEYARVLANGLLSHSIADFRAQFNPLTFTDEKIIDSLIWAFVAELLNGGVAGGRIVYM